MFEDEYAIFQFQIICHDSWIFPWKFEAHMAEALYRAGSSVIPIMDVGKRYQIHWFCRRSEEKVLFAMCSEQHQFDRFYVDPVKPGNLERSKNTFYIQVKSLQICQVGLREHNVLLQVLGNRAAQFLALEPSLGEQPISVPVSTIT